LSSYLNPRLFIADILASKIYEKMIFCSQSKHLNKQKNIVGFLYLSLSTWAWFPEAPTLLYRYLTPHILWVYISLCIFCNCQSISVSKTDGSSSCQSRCHTSLSSFFPLQPMRFSFISAPVTTVCLSLRLCHSILS